MARSLTIQLCGAGSIITNVCSVSTMCARRVKLRMATERLRRLYDRVTGGLHPYLVLLVGECLCVPEGETTKRSRVSGRPLTLN
jgi:hypothetical protein